jgi:hypothetical protein
MGEIATNTSCTYNVNLFTIGWMTDKCLLISLYEYSNGGQYINNFTSPNAFPQFGMPNYNMDNKQQ